MLKIALLYLAFTTTHMVGNYFHYFIDENNQDLEKSSYFPTVTVNKYRKR